MDARLLDMLGQIAKGIAAQFGPNCEVVVHEISDKSAYSSIVAISLMFEQPRFFSSARAASALPPVASIGSTTMTSRSAISLGSLQK